MAGNVLLLEQTSLSTPAAGYLNVGAKTDGLMYFKDPSGNERVANTWGAGTLTADNPLTITQTWNNAAVTFNAISLAITDTTSNAASKLLSATVGGVSKFSVDKAGNTVVGGTLGITGDVTLNSSVLRAADGNALINRSGNKTQVGTGAASAYTTLSCAAAADSLILDASGNLGLGVTPSAWQSTSGSRAIQFTGSSVYSYRDSNLILSQNAYYDGAWKYYASSIAPTQYNQGSGAHSWSVAASGTAGNAITWTTAMTLDTAGRLFVGPTSGDAVWGKTTGTAQAALSGWNATDSGDGHFAHFYTDVALVYRGSITYNRGGGLVAYNTTSDYRAKDIIGSVNADVVLSKLNPVMGCMKGATIPRPMLIAHEAQEFAPWAVTGEKDAVDAEGKPIYQQLGESSFVPLLIAGYQELAARVAALEGASPHVIAN